jgi:hypothetical protein
LENGRREEKFSIKMDFQNNGIILTFCYIPNPTAEKSM